MNISLTDVYGQTITYYDIYSVFLSNVQDDILCILNNEHKLIRINLSALNYWEVVKR